MTVLLPASPFSRHFCNPPSIRYSFSHKTSICLSFPPLKGSFRIHGSSDKLDTPITMDEQDQQQQNLEINKLEERENNTPSTSTSAPAIEKDLKKVSSL